VLANTGTKFAGRLSSGEDVQLMIDALLLHQVLGPELRRKLLPGQMYGQLLYAAGDDAIWGRGHRCYTIPLPLAVPPPISKAYDAASAWFARKLEGALLNAFKVCVQRMRNQSPGSGMARELEGFLQRRRLAAQ
jgi:hypothetical protein